MANSVDLDEMAHFEPPHQHLHCLQIQLFSSLVPKELSHLIVKKNLYEIRVESDFPETCKKLSK